MCQCCQVRFSQRRDNPQLDCTSCTHCSSHPFSQQNGSNWHICVTHASDSGASWFPLSSTRRVRSIPRCIGRFRTNKRDAICSRMSQRDGYRRRPSMLTCCKQAGDCRNNYDECEVGKQRRAQSWPKMDQHRQQRMWIGLHSRVEII